MASIIANRFNQNLYVVGINAIIEIIAYRRAHRNYYHNLLNFVLITLQRRLSRSTKIDVLDFDLFGRLLQEFHQWFPELRSHNLTDPCYPLCNIKPLTQKLVNCGYKCGDYLTTVTRLHIPLCCPFQSNCSLNMSVYKTNQPFNLYLPLFRSFLSLPLHLTFLLLQNID